MPGYRSAERKHPPNKRSKLLVESAETLVANRWSGRSWTEVGYSVAGAAAGALQWVTGIGVKIGINVASGGLFGALGERIIARAEAVGYGPESLGRKIGDNAVEYFWPLVEDVIKGVAEETVQAGGTKVASYSNSAQIAAQATQRAKQAFEDNSVEDVVGRLKTTVAEMMLRSSALKKALQNGNLNYCDNVHYMALELYQIEALRAEILSDAAHLQAYAEAISQLADEIKVRELYHAIRGAADKVVASKDVPHYNAYSWNVLSRAAQCSEAHCWGPHTDHL